MAYTPIIVTVDPAQITLDKIAALQARIPGLVIREGHPIYHLLEVTSDRDGENLQLLSDQFDAVWDSYGKQILRLARNPATRATGLSTWTRVSTAEAPLASPLTIPAGTQITLAGTGGDRYAFETVNAVTFVAAAASTAAGEVQLIAVEPGAAGNALQGDPKPEQTFTWLSTITVTAPTAGGAEEEDSTVYRNRIADEASIMGRTLVQAANFAIASRGVTGVDRALAIDNYDPGPPIVNPASGHITVAVIDTAGADPGATVRANVLAELVSRQMSNLVSHVIAATYTVIKVAFHGVPVAGYDPVDVNTRAQQAVLDFLKPLRWGLPALGDQRLWLDTPVVRFQDLLTVLNNVEGLDRTDPVTGTATTTNASPNLTLVSPTTGWVNEMVVTGTGIPAGTRILSGAGTATLVLSANATASAAGVAITGAALSVNGGTADVTMTGPAALPSAASTAAGTVA